MTIKYWIGGDVPGKVVAEFETLPAVGISDLWPKI